MKKQELKELLKNIKDKDYTLSYGINQNDLALMMMDNIGDIDSELRDDLILSNLCNWIIEGVMSTSEISELLKTALDEKHLLKG
ncbi:MAG: hypothetical protein Q8930_14975, partial [Bacillota bacterium]|nr:hypothetical protein [Bacillota bacterium]